MIHALIARLTQMDPLLIKVTRSTFSASTIRLIANKLSMKKNMAL